MLHRERTKKRNRPRHIPESQKSLARCKVVWDDRGSVSRIEVTGSDGLVFTYFVPTKKVVDSKPPGEKFVVVETGECRMVPDTKKPIMEVLIILPTGEVNGQSNMATYVLTDCVIPMEALK